MVESSGCLLVANQTVGSAGLKRAIEERVDAGSARFFVLVPLIKPSAEAAGWAPMQTPAGFARGAVAEAAARDEATTRSIHRMNYLMDTITAMGGTAEGSVGSTNPVVAVRRLLGQHTFDEVLVSTLPPGMSRWLRLDVPARIGRLTQLPVTVVQAEPVAPA